MPEVGEEIVGTWLRYIRGCTFVDYNVQIAEGEIDVIGLNLGERHAYICEVATHTQGLGYKDNAKTITDKMRRAVEYGEGVFQGFGVTYMFWSPVVRSGSQTEALIQVQRVIREELHREVEFINNKDYVEKLGELRDHAKGLTRNAAHPVLRLMQVEERAREYAGLKSK